MDVHDLAAAPVEAAADAAEQWSEVARGTESSGTAVRGHAELPGWSGTASDAMRHRLDSSGNRLLAVSVAARWAGVVLRNHAAVLARLRAQVAPILTMSLATGMVVSPDGTVTPPVALPPWTVQAAAASLVLHACRALATTLDEAPASVVSAVCAVRDAPVVDTVLVAGDRGISVAGAAVTELLADPAATAAAVTLPAGTADGPRGSALREAVVAARRELALRGLDPDAVGVAVELVGGEPTVVVGDIRTADKISTLVSGVGSSSDGALVGSAGGAGRIAGPGHAVVTWHGYTAPGSVSHGMNPSFAGVGAPALRELQSSLRDTSARGTELQVVAHSYGTTLVGAAARDPSAPLAADTLHLLGSPGVGVQRADQLHVDALDGRAEVHTWRAPGDLIGAAAGSAGGVHGVDPTAAGFGADSVNGVDADRRGGAVGRILERMTDGYLWFRGEWDSHSSYLSDDHVLGQVR
ncbi:alpha/beta hydrolase [Corynebacterium sp.]|uniref:alpha/beta hydrolase n=1 Tax=Corynebacterium sp. TaxID=1720 RepID=UPI0025C38D4E|nr:alpha/beta hydrolase [Corynebacterium sp.]